MRFLARLCLSGPAILTFKVPKTMPNPGRNRYKTCHFQNFVRYSPQIPDWHNS